MNIHLKDLKPAPPSRREQGRDTVLHSLSGAMGVDFHYNRIPKPLVRMEVPEGQDAYHKNYLEYLCQCYGRHFGAVVSPELLWFTVLSELAEHIKANAEHYRHLFTTSDEQVDVSVLSLDLEVMPIGVLLEYVQRVCPMDASRFVPEFSTSTPRSHTATMSLFLDAVSPYYSYSMYACGIPDIMLRGTREDWVLFQERLQDLQGVVDKAAPYLERVGARIAQIVGCYDGELDVDFWIGMFSNERCGSGGEVLCKGWYPEEFFMTYPKLGKPDNFPTQVAQVNYKQLDTGLEYKMFQGLFSSTLQDGFLVPDFGFTVELAEHQWSEDIPTKPGVYLAQGMQGTAEGKVMVVRVVEHYSEEIGDGGLHVIMGNPQSHSSLVNLNINHFGALWAPAPESFFPEVERESRLFH